MPFDATATSRRQSTNLWRRPEAGAVFGLLLVYLFFAFSAQNGFLTLSGTASWVNIAAELGVVAVPIGLLMIAGEFDLSIGSVIGASSVTVGIMTGIYHLPLLGAVATVLVFGALVGLMNGMIVVRTGLPSFIVTLASLFIVAGAALGMSRWLVGTTSVSVPGGMAFAEAFGGRWQGFNVSLLWWLGVTAATAWVLGRTAFGNWVYATGANRQLALQAGVPVGRVKTILFILSSCSAALVGVLLTLQYRGGDVTYGRDFVFAAPVAAVIGGVLLSGGYGSTVGVALGTMIYGIVNLGIFYTGWNSDWAQLVLGALLLLAVLGNNWFRTQVLSGARR